MEKQRTKMLESRQSRRGTSLLMHNLAKKKKIRYLLEKNTNETTRQWVSRNLERSTAGNLYDSFQTMLSIMMVGMFAYSNWEKPESHRDENGSNMKDIEIISGAIFTFEYVFRLYAAEHRVDYVFSFFSIVDVLTVLPVWIELVVSSVTGGEGAVAFQKFSAPIRVLKALRVLRAYRLLGFAKSIVQRQLFITLLTIVSLILCTAGIIQTLEQCDGLCEYNCKCQDLSFFDSVYFVVVTITTVGYGDISPKNKIARIVTATIILLTFVIVPIQVNTLIEVISSHSGHTNAYKKQHPHAVMTGTLEPQSVDNFLHEFFHPDNPNWNEKVVILHPLEPSPEFSKIIHQFEPRVQYIVGSAMLDQDLERAGVFSASVCYVFVEKRCDDVDQSDQSSSLLTTALRRANTTAPIFSQVFSSENMAHISLSGSTAVICIEKLKFSLIATGCLNAGLTTLISNLLCTISIDTKLSKSELGWKQNYIHGVAHEIYPVDIPRSFAGLTYGEFSLLLYIEFKAVPLVVIQDNNTIIVSKDYKLGSHAHATLCCTVYIITQSLSTVDRIEKCPRDRILVLRQDLKRQFRDRASTDKCLPKTAMAIPNLDVNTSPVKPSSDCIPHNPIFHGIIDKKIQHYNEFINKPIPPDLADHIVVCGLPLTLSDFVKPIRELAVDKTHPIVLLSPTLLTEHQFQAISMYSDIYFKLGSPLSASDLIYACIATAKSIVVLNPIEFDQFYEDVNMVDADSITSTRYIHELCGKDSTNSTPQVIVEVIMPSNIKFLSLFGGNQVIKREHSSRRISGPPNRIAHQLSIRKESAGFHLEDHVDVSNIGSDYHSHIFQPAYVSGGVYLSDFLDTLMSESYRKHHFVNVISALLGVSDKSYAKENRRLVGIPLPTAFIGLAYSQLFVYLLKKDFICLGLWRGVDAGSSNPACVFTNPPQSLPLEESDNVFIIGNPQLTKTL